MLLAMLLSFVIIMVYMRVMMPPPPAPTESEVTAERVHTPRPVEVPSPEEREKPGMAEVRKRAPEGELSTAENGALQVIFGGEGGSVARGTLRRSEVIKKGPVEIISPLTPAIQPLLVRIPGLLENDAEIAYSRVSGEDGIAYSASSGGLAIKKRYTMPEDGYVVMSSVELVNETDETLPIEDGIEVEAGVIFALLQTEKEGHLGVEVAGPNGTISRIASSKIGDGRREYKPIRWIAARNQFFAVVLKPAGGAAGYSASRVKSDEDLHGVRAAVRLPGFTLGPREGRTFPIDIYLGPKEYSALAAFGAEGVMDFGWFGFLGRWILRGLNILYGICGNYGVAIILLTVLIRIILYPLNQKSFKSMKEMQKIQPQIAALQSKYKDDPKRKQQEMMRIYKEHHINPMGGCLPLLIQMPILIAFFRVLQNAIELWGAPFLLWMKDLSEPDALFSFPTGSTVVPFIGRVENGQGYILLNVLPIMLLLVFYIQQKMSTPGAPATPEQAQQQKIMGYMMPIMFGVIFYNMPSGLNLYFAASTLLGIVQQKYMIG
ncbi:MAG: membrane protein insertase YidC [bacterium]|nr:membrane protein insertase YidC [bacterium]